VSAQGFFHDAHEVYLVKVNPAGEIVEQEWIATFVRKNLAEQFRESTSLPPLPDGLRYELGVVPV